MGTQAASAANGVDVMAYRFARGVMGDLAGWRGDAGVAAAAGGGRFHGGWGGRLASPGGICLKLNASNLRTVLS